MHFFRFPHTPHLACLGEGRPRNDKVLSPHESRELLTHNIVVEEKVDGANVGLSVDEDGNLRAQNRGAYLSRDLGNPQFKPLFQWLEPRRTDLANALFPDLMLFGEWCYAVHSIHYTKLPDWFLAFDVYDRGQGEFWSSSRRDELVQRLGLALVPRLGAGRFDIVKLQAMLLQSRLAAGPPEGLYVRWDEGERLIARAKLVRCEYIRGINEHWSRRALEPNLLAAGAFLQMSRVLPGRGPGQRGCRATPQVPLKSPLKSEKPSRASAHGRNAR